MQSAKIRWFNKGLEVKNNKIWAVGSDVQWKWMGRLIDGQVIEIYFESVAKNIKGKVIKRNASKENPAYLLQSEAGNYALKLHSELQSNKIEKVKDNKPKMFSKKI